MGTRRSIGLKKASFAKWHRPTPSMYAAYAQRKEAIYRAGGRVKGEKKHNAEQCEEKTEEGKMWSDAEAI